MPKLHLKRTPQEEAAHNLRKKIKKEEKRRRRHLSRSYDHDNANGNVNANINDGSADSSMKWASDDDEPIGPHPAEAGPSSSTGNYHSYSYSNTGPMHGHKPDWDAEAIQAQVEEQRFREKMSLAFEDDERLDSLEARMNGFAHVPMRWGGGRSDTAQTNVYADDEEYFEADMRRGDPNLMEGEQYAEWIRAGMYRKTHAKEYAAAQHAAAQRSARKAAAKALAAETARLEKETEERRKRRKEEKENRKWDWAREEYEGRWKVLLELKTNPKAGKDITAGTGAKTTKDEGTLGFMDIPWPILAVYKQPSQSHKPDKDTAKPIKLSPDDLTASAISTFLLSSSSPSSSSATVPSQSSLTPDEAQKRKEKLRLTFLRFHPDKFEGRFMARVKEEDRERVREGLGCVVRALNGLA